MNKTGKDRFICIIPVYNHEQKIRDVVDGARQLHIPVIVVDDGSTDNTFNNIKSIEGITILRHEHNRGKGAAIKTAFAHCAGTADWAITIDGDGQHNPQDAVNMMQAVKKGTRPIFLGMRENMVGDDVPWTSRFGKKFSNFWVWASGGGSIRDSQSGFRMYPLPESCNLETKADRYQFEVEILARAGWKKIPVVEIPISVSYTPGTERISHFRPFIDFVRNSKVFSRLIFQRIFIPRKIRIKMF